MLARWAGALTLGVLVGAFGTVVHRTAVPWGIAVCLAFVLASGMLARAWCALAGLLAYGLGWVAAVQVLSLAGPGGDVLVPGGQPIGYVWVGAGMLMVAAAAFAPARWFRDTPPDAGE